MRYFVVGLGNPGEKYENTRHNTGRIVLECFRKKHAFSEWEFDKKLNALVSEGGVGKEKVTLLLPETYMNKSGNTVKRITNYELRIKDEPVIVVHDDLDLPLGTFKISFNRGSGGHKGLESVMRALKTKAFVRVRVGITPTTPSGKLRKPKGEAAVEKFILGTFTPAEEKKLAPVARKASEALTVIVGEGRVRAANEFN